MRAWLVLLLAVVFAGNLRAGERVDYLRDVKPLLAEKCAACHGAGRQEAGLRLDAGVLVKKGGDDGPVIAPGKSGASLLITKITAKDPEERMPPDGEGEPLSTAQVAILSAWIDAGAVVPADEVIPVDPRKHWAYQPPKRPSLPRVDARWSHPIDAFIAREHGRLGLTAVETADRYTLLRRLYLGLIGLPPTRGQIAAFMRDESDGAWGKLVDSLLNSPHHGERWGRHWMDVWRYSDWDGYKNQLRGSQRHIWRWRDWIVQSLNEDKGYDRMIVEMLAGDEAAPADAAVLPATGFLARNFHKSNRNMWLDATVEHTAKAFLGLTLNCARCHDHKYDPMPQTAYYQFRAIFEPHNIRTDRIPGQSDVMKDGLPRAFDADLVAKTFLYLRGNEKHPDKDRPMKPATPAVLGGELKIQPVRLPAQAYYPSLRDFVVQEQLAAAQKQLAAAEKKVARRSAALSSSRSHDQDAAERRATMKELELHRFVARLRVQSLQNRIAAERAKFSGGDDQKAKTLAQAAAKSERELNAAVAKLAVHHKKAALKAAASSGAKDAKKRQAAVAKATKELADSEEKLKAAQDALAKTDGEYQPLGKAYPDTSSGRRLALARWIVSKDNPLTARVAVNHIWMRHFGAPLVENVFDFGLRSPRPRHAGLLDWLAVELMENGWSTKHLHRLIVTSRTWRLASSAAEASRNGAIDRDNHFLWRANVRRLEAEIVRDCVLAVGGQLDASRGGPDIDFRLSETSRRRSIYLRHAYEKQSTMLVLFDAASPNECYRRSESIVPQQALALSNSSLSLGQSRLLASQLWREASTKKDAEPQFVQSAFRQVLSRSASREELSACLDFLADQAKTLADTSKLTTFAGGSAPKVKPATDPRQRARENLVHVLMNHNDFVTVR